MSILGPNRPKREKTGGRQKGSLNKLTVTVKEAIEKAAEGLGGHERMVSWAKEDPANERVFWGQIYPKLLPHMVTGDGGGPLVVEITRFGSN